MINPCLWHCSQLLIQNLSERPNADSDYRSSLAVLVFVLQSCFPDQKDQIKGLTRAYKRGPFSAYFRILGIGDHLLNLDGLTSWEALKASRTPPNDQHPWLWSKQINEYDVTSTLDWEFDPIPCDRKVLSLCPELLAHCQVFRDQWHLDHQTPKVMNKSTATRL